MFKKRILAILYTTGTEKMEELIMREQSMLIKILMVIGLFFAGSVLLSLILGLLGSVLWFGVKILLPLAIVVWLIRLITNPSRNRRRYY